MHFGPFTNLAKQVVANNAFRLLCELVILCLLLLLCFFSLNMRMYNKQNHSILQASWTVNAGITSWLMHIMLEFPDQEQLCSLSGLGSTSFG